MNSDIKKDSSPIFPDSLDVRARARAFDQLGRSVQMWSLAPHSEQTTNAINNTVMLPVPVVIRTEKSMRAGVVHDMLAVYLAGMVSHFS